MTYCLQKRCRPHDSRGCGRLKREQNPIGSGSGATNTGPSDYEDGPDERFMSLAYRPSSIALSSTPSGQIHPLFKKSWQGFPYFTFEKSALIRSSFPSCKLITKVEAALGSKLS